MIQNSASGPTEIAEKIFWVGTGNQIAKLNCNPYLILDGDEGVLIDPGSPLDFDAVAANVEQLIPISRLRYIILQHQDPDFCASTPLFEKRGFCGELATHWRAAPLIRFYGVTSSFYIINEHELRLTFGNGRTLLFVPTPYLHFSGAIATYDPVGKVLFSSDLFGSFAENPPLYADQWPDDEYIEDMKSFHEHYMPSNAILRATMNKLDQLDIHLIAPQHGSAIRWDISRYIHALRDLECGNFLQPARHNLPALDGYTSIVNQVLKRYYALFSHQEAAEIFAGTDICLNRETGLLADFNCSGQELWNRLFYFIHSRRGIMPLIYIEPFVKKLTAEYDIEMPEIFASTLLSMEDKSFRLSRENQKLAEKNLLLKEHLATANERLLQCPITKLPNEQVFRQFLTGECQSYMEAQTSGALLLIGIDHMARINLQYGNAAGDEVLKIVTYLLTETLQNSYTLFKVDGPVFACYLPDTNKETAFHYGESMRNRIEQSDRMLERVTVSVGVLTLDDFRQQPFADYIDFAKTVFHAAKSSLNQARHQGGNQVSVMAESAVGPSLGKILLVDTDELHLDVLETLLTDLHFLVLKARDGEEALSLIEQESPEVVISEVLLPKMDAFMLREKMLLQSANQEISFILVSFQKNEENIQRAFALNIEHYFQKPYILPELLGLIQLKFRQRNGK